MSRDDGQTWTLADTGLDDINGFSIVGFRRNGRILATIADVRSTGSSSILMSSDDYGASWRSLGHIPGAFPQLYVSSDIDTTDHGGWGRIYAVANRETNSSVAIPLQPIVETDLLGQPWRPIPLPPMPAGTATTEQSRELFTVGVGPAASLEVERGIVEEPQAQLSPARLLWLWIPSKGRWYQDPQPLPGNLQIQGDAWKNGAQTLWVTVLRLGVPPVLEIYFKTLDPNPLQGAT